MTERLAYNPSFDRRDFSLINKVDSKEQERLSRFIDKQIDTHLGERFNVLQSRITYEVIDGKIFGEETSEPFIDIIKKGVVTKREKAELEGFEKIETFFANTAENGDMLLSVSPPGGEYLHNFYDIFTLREEGEKKFVDMTRYSSALSLPDYNKRLQPLKVFEEEPTDIDFLRDPISVNKSLFKTADDIHTYLHKEHNFLTTEQFEKIIKSSAVTQLKSKYIDYSFSENEEMQFITFNAIYNAADMALDSQNKGDYEIFELNSSLRLLTKEDIYYLGTQPVRVVQTPCGASGGFSMGGVKEAMNSPFRVFDKNLNKQTAEWFTCPKCTYKADGPIGNTCPGCGITKEEFAEEGGTTCD